MENRVLMLCENRESPLGIDTAEPVFSWKIKSGCGIRQQTGYIIMAAETREELEKERNLLWKYEEKTGRQRIRYGGRPLRSGRQYFWKLYLEYDFREKTVSGTGCFETGLLDSNDWKAEWISPEGARVKQIVPPLNEDWTLKDVAPEDMGLEPVWRLRREFEVTKPVKRARLYAAACGVYIPVLDGKKTGSYELAPGHVDYEHRIPYQVYDITRQLAEGKHVLGALLSSGWYAGHIGFFGENCIYGDEPALLMQIEITYEDGRREVWGTDRRFQAEPSSWIYADIMIGEKIDGTKRNPSFWQPGYTQVPSVCEVKKKRGILFAQLHNSIEILEELSPVSLKHTGEREWVADFGRCIAGKVRILLNQPRGQKIQVEHSETLDKAGNFIRNIREPYRNQTDIYLCSGTPEAFEPMFSYYGFRYIRIRGITGALKPENLKAYAVGTRLEKTGGFCCSDSRLNRLQTNIVQSQLNNMASIPTDCPQREKSGWTGDVQVYAETACFNQNMEAFFRNWLKDVRISQKSNGEIPIIVPAFRGAARAFEGVCSSAGWSDVIVLLPWVLYQYYGNKEILEENYDAMVRWIEFERSTAETKNPDFSEKPDEERRRHLKYIWNTGFHFGDWLTPSASINFDTGQVEMMQSAFLTSKIVPTIFFALGCQTMQKIAGVLGKREDEKYYGELYNHIKEAFQYEFLNEESEIESSLQGVFVLALHAELLDGISREKAQKRLAELIHENGDKLDTGFLSTPFLMEELVKMGEEELACKILLCEDCPSWLYEIRQGATSIWESWQGILPNGECSYLSMSHYAFGCVGIFLYRYFGGLYCLEPGFKSFRIAPVWDSILSSAELHFESVYGEISCRWKREQDQLKMSITVPVNTTAELQPPKTGVYMKLDPGSYEFVFSRTGTAKAEGGEVYESLSS